MIEENGGRHGFQHVLFRRRTQLNEINLNPKCMEAAEQQSQANGVNETIAPQHGCGVLKGQQFVYEPSQESNL